jgi:FlaA1/EpsC-like NDP-sugar epimerase
MTIPEASGLVMQAGAMARCGELFVLDMGNPVKIYDLAENMIRLSGLRPHVDIEIVESGLRPGEKLYEELLIKTEELIKTENNMIFIERDTPLTRDEIDARIDVLNAAVLAAEREVGAESVTDAMKAVVPTFHSPSEVNREAENSREMRTVSAV